MMKTNQFDLDEASLEYILGPKPDLSAESSGIVVSTEEEAKSELARLAQLSALLDKLEETQKVSGMNKWFIPGTMFSIDNCPKHKAFFSAGADYSERLFMAANRSGKSVSGALESSYHATG